MAIYFIYKLQQNYFHRWREKNDATSQPGPFNQGKIQEELAFHVQLMIVRVAIPAI